MREMGRFATNRAFCLKIMLAKKLQILRKWIVIRIFEVGVAKELRLLYNKHVKFISVLFQGGVKVSTGSEEAFAYKSASHMA